MRNVTIASLCLLDGAQYVSADHVLGVLGRAFDLARPDLVVTPFLPFLSFREGFEAEDLQPFGRCAAEHRAYLALALTEERADGTRSHTALLLDREGRPAARYRKTHLLPDDDGLTPGDDLPVVRTDFGLLGFSLTSDLYFPEVYWTAAMKGAEIVLWQTAPERFRQHHDLPALLKARCLDGHIHMVTAMFADPRTYVTNRYEIGMQGAAWGRSQVLNRVGVPVADTGYADGVATATVDLAKRKADPFAPWYQGENVFFTNCMGDRTAFRPLAEPYAPPRLPRYRKRTARVAVLAQGSDSIWRSNAPPERMLSLLDSAAAVKPDLILLTEMAAKVTDPRVQEGMEQVARRARALGAYVVIGGLGDDAFLSIARVWDRTGREVFAEPIYWTKGFPELSVFDTDFARIGIHLCGDLYTGEIDRVLALKGAELILDPSQYWGAGGENDAPILQARAADNGCWLACAHWNTSDAAHRSVIVDPYGVIVAASRFQREGLIHTDIDFDDLRVYYAGRKAEQPTPGTVDIPSYYSGDIPEQRPGWRAMLFARRRPELYAILPTVNEVTLRYRPAQNPWESGGGAGC